jgi:hypothetical protein
MVNTTPSERDRFWLDHEAKIAASGQTAKQYAADQKLSLHALYQSRKRLRSLGLFPASGRKDASAEALGFFASSGGCERGEPSSRPWILPPSSWWCHARMGGRRVARSGGAARGAVDLASMMRPDEELEVYVYRQVVDMRKSINGLSAIVEQELEVSPFSPPLCVWNL